MDVESALIIFAWVVKIKSVKDRSNISVEPIVALTRKRDITVGEFRNGLFRITIQLGLCFHSGFGGIFAVIFLIVVGSDDALVVRGTYTGTQHSALSQTMIDFCDRVGLDEVLVAIAHVLDPTEIIVQSRFGVLGLAGETERIAQRGAPGGQVVA